MRHPIALAATSALLLLAGCGEKPKTSQPVIKPAGGDAAGSSAPVAPVEQPPTTPSPLAGVDLTAAAEYNSRQVLQPVYFETDSAEIPPGETPKLDSNVKWLADHPQFKLLVEGNCDERNTEEYNLALGQQRADKIKAYLTGKGVSASRIKTISYGETQPADSGHEESAWRKNRRTEFKLLDR